MIISMKKLSSGILSALAKYEPLYLVFSFPHLIAASSLTLAGVYFPKVFIGQLERSESFHKIAVSIVTYILLLIALKCFDAFFVYKADVYRERFKKNIRCLAGELTMAQPLSEIEGTGFADKLTMSGKVTQLTDAFAVFLNIATDLITIAGLSFMISLLDFAFLLTIAVVVGMKLIFVCLTQRYQKKRRLLYAANDRIGNYLDSTAYTSPGAAKELRINSLGGWYMDKIKGFRERMLTLQYGDFNRYAAINVLSGLILALQSLVILISLAAHLKDGVIGIADFTMYFTAVTTLTLKLSSIITLIGEYNSKKISLKDFDELFHSDESDTTRKGVPENREIVFENVWFAYPGSDKYVLRNINITIKSGEKLSVVGMNGAGKSTFIKLLCRFYKPTRGRITLGGVDISEIDETEYNHIIAAVFQDFQNLPFTVRENITLGKDVLTEIPESGEWIGALPDGLDTYVGRVYEASGVELSGGEGQKLEILRAIHKNTPILILDEPTASLDPIAESEIYDRYFEIAKNKTTIFVSHRLASSMIADRIAVFSQGEIIGCDTHDELLVSCPMYAEMFRLQKRGYSDLR